MNTPNSVLVLIGSPRRESSTSDSMGTYLMDRLREKGVNVKKLHLKKAMGATDSMDEVFTSIDAADTLVFVFPLYVDSVPAHVVAAMEKIYGQYRTGMTTKKKGVLAIVNSGFFNPDNNDVAIGTMRRFTDLSGFQWQGGLSLCGGNVIDGKPMSELGNSVKGIKRSLDLTADALADGKPMPDEAARLMQQPVVPPFLPAFFLARIGNMGFKKQAKEKGVSKQLMDRPYEKT